MEDLKELVLDYREFVTNVLITEDELYSNYLCNLDETLKEHLRKNYKLQQYVEQMIESDILHSFIFFPDYIESELINATEFFEEEYSKKETLEIYKKIKKVFKDFRVKELESEI